jgi:putative nucleotidyltransferase with HDIG domain
VSQPQLSAPADNSVAAEEANWFGTNDQAVAEENAGRSMAALVGRIIGAKPFPMSARRLADLTRLDVVRIEPVIHVLESDPGLSARLLRLVNSAGYALRQRCTSVRHAATLVGTDRLHQIATTAAVLDLFDSKSPFAAQIIEHSTVVGAFCRYLGAHLALPVDDLFTAGFLHDIGKLMLMETEGDQYVELLTSCASHPDSIHLLERKLYGFDHAALAAHVLSAWNIPEPVPKIVAWHHAPAQAYKASSLMASLVQTIRLSDAMVYAMRQGTDRAGIKELADHEAAGYLEISEPQLAAMWDELRVLFNECQQQCWIPVRFGQDNRYRCRSSPRPASEPMIFPSSFLVSSVAALHSAIPVLRAMDTSAPTIRWAAMRGVRFAFATTRLRRSRFRCPYGPNGPSVLSVLQSCSVGCSE